MYNINNYIEIAMRYFFLLLSLIFAFFSSAIIMVYFQMIFGIEEPNIIPIALEGTMDYFDAKYTILGQDIGSILFSILCLILFFYFYSLYHKYSRKKKDTYNVADIHGPFILYLRSFAADKTTNKRISFVDIISEEEALVEAMSDIAPVYAIGDPKDKKMPNGASRIYVDDEHWKSTVIDMASKAALVVLRLGKTDSFWWEVEMVIKTVPINKLVFVVPTSKTFNEVSVLYKILLQNNINIDNLNISIEKNQQGSISNLIYFDKEGKPHTDRIKTSRFTQIFLKYSDIVRKSLVGIRTEYGLSSPKMTIRKARILQLLLIIFFIYIGGAMTFAHYMELKYQRPYEIAERCAKNEAFVQKYSNEINNNTLVYCILEAKNGLISLSEEQFKYVLLVEMHTLKLMTEEEFERLSDAPYNMLLLVKKYTPQYYDAYINIVSEAAINSVQYPDYIKEMYETYYSLLTTDSIPEWLIDVYNKTENSPDEYKNSMLITEAIYEHFDDNDIIITQKKILSSQYFEYNNIQ